MFSLKKLLSNNGQISLEFSILMIAVIVAGVIVGYYMIETSQNVRDTNMDTINRTSNTILQVLSTV